MISIHELIQVIQDYFPDRIQLGTQAAEVQDIADLYGIPAHKVAYAVNQLAMEIE